MYKFLCWICIFISLGLTVFFIVFQVNISVHWVVRVFLSVLFIFAVWMLYARAWPLIQNKLPIKDMYNAGASGLVGKTGKVHVVYGKKMAQIDGDLYPFYGDNELSDGDTFKVAQVKDGKVKIK